MNTFNIKLELDRLGLSSNDYVISLQGPTLFLTIAGEAKLEKDSDLKEKVSNIIKIG